MLTADAVTCAAKRIAMMSVIIGVLLTLGAFSFQAATPKQPGCGTVESPFGEAQCVQISFVSEISAGQRFERKFGDNLVFRLNPSGASGWFIEVIPEAQGGTDKKEYVWVVTPPYRFSNVRYLDTSYGTKAREAVHYSPRDFNFVLNEEQFNRAADLVNLAIFSHPLSDQRTKEELIKESEDAREALLALSVSKGRLTILDSRTTEPEGADDFGSIEWLKFKVELQVPCGSASVPGSDLAVDVSKCSRGKEAG